MTKIEMAIKQTNWAIERERKNLEEQRLNIKGYIDSEHMEYDAEWILNYAEKLNESAKKLKALEEQRDMLTYLAE